MNAELRLLIAKVITTEGCDCCERKDHKKLKDELAEAIHIPPYHDGSGYDWFSVAKNEK